MACSARPSCRPAAWPSRTPASWPASVSAVHAAQREAAGREGHAGGDGDDSAPHGEAKRARPPSVHPGAADRLHVAAVGAAAAAEHRHGAQARAQRAVLGAERGGIALVELLGLVELGVALGRRVGAQAADALAPGAVRPRARRRSASGARS